MEKLLTYLEYSFVWYALIVGVLIALCSSLLGVTLVLKRFSYIGDGLSHAAFGAMAVSAILGITSNTILVLPVTIICAVLLLKMGENSKISGDAAVAVVSVGALAIGYFLMSVFSTSSNLSGDVCTTLFGAASILTLREEDVIICIVLSILVIGFFIVFYNKIFAITYDESFARAIGTKVDFYKLIISIVIAVIIVLAMNLVGALLISALIIFPALSAMRLFTSFRAVTIGSTVVSVVCALAGMIISIVAGTPVGSTIVIINIGVLLICMLVSRLKVAF
ncbi:metal ABC transporter permease [Eubacterium sp.]|uniref:metal ABC transporter permease n=1 Tax=Eubacterium sp. TaxID=142586 RepID=UPI0025D6C9E5|nr:metal ABC transporter permease [Eubacterium sp.]MCR5628506.1 metal ABC transporter permease [Eubacterium sp.]